MLVCSSNLLFLWSHSTFPRVERPTMPRTTQRRQAGAPKPCSSKLMRLSASPAAIERIIGERVHKATPQRWATRGVSGVKLRTIYAGGCRRTTEEWIQEFFDAVTAAKSTSEPRSHSNDSKKVSTADQELRDAGI